MRASRRAPRSHLLSMLVAESKRTRPIAVIRTVPMICPWGERAQFRKFEHEVPTSLGYEAAEIPNQMSKTSRADAIRTTFKANSPPEAKDYTLTEDHSRNRRQQAKPLATSPGTR